MSIQSFQSQGRVFWGRGAWSPGRPTGGREKSWWLVQPKGALARGPVVGGSTVGAGLILNFWGQVLWLASFHPSQMLTVQERPPWWKRWGWRWGCGHSGCLFWWKTLRLQRRFGFHFLCRPPSRLIVNLSDCQQLCCHCSARFHFLWSYLSSHLRWPHRHPQLPQLVGKCPRA